MNDAETSRPPSDSVLFGTAYYPDHWPESDWARDLDRIAAAGNKTVRFGEFSWTWFEPSPGQFDFAAYDRFVKLVEERSLRLLLCTPTATPPPWFDRIFPDGRMLDMRGDRCLRPRHFWSWNHAASRAQAEKTILALAEHFRDCPVLWGWQIDNEPNYAEQVNVDTPERMYDFHPEARAAFRQWLSDQYGDIEALNTAWYANFWSQRCADWDEAVLIRGQTNPQAWLDFMRWREANMAEFVHWQAGLLRAITPNARIGCNIPETGVKASVSIGQDYWAQAAGLDWVGTDLYQATGNRTRDLERLAASTDLMRSAAGNAAFYLSETQGGPHERAWPNDFAGEGFGPDYLQDSATIYAERGAEQIWWFLWRATPAGVEMGMNGVQNLDGSDSPRTALVTRLAAKGEKLAAKRKRWLKRPLAFLHYSRDSFLFASAHRPMLDTLDDSLTGWHSWLEACGFRVDFLNDDLILEGAATGGLLVLPHAMIASDELVAAIANHEGAIVAGPNTAFCDGNGHIRPSRLPEALALKWKVQFGLWRSTGKLPKISQLPQIGGYRELVPAGGATIRGRFADKYPWCVQSAKSSVFGVDAGYLFFHASPAGRRKLCSLDVFPVTAKL